jgi:hypothetical protein
VPLNCMIIPAGGVLPLRTTSSSAPGMATAAWSRAAPARWLTPGRRRVSSCLLSLA